MSTYQPGPGEGRLGKQLKLISRHLDAAGNGTGNKNFVADYSGAQEIAYIQPPAGKIYRIARMLVLVSGKATNFNPDNYGSANPLTTGVQVRIQDNSGTIVDLTDGLPVKTNGCWGRVCFDAKIYENISSNLDNYLRVRWTFAASGQQIRLIGDNNERLEVILNDDFTVPASSPLSKQHFVVQGFEEDPAEP